MQKPYENLVSIGDALKKIRKERNMSMNELAEKAKMSGASISLIERGKLNFTMQTFMKICQSLDTYIDINIFPVNNQKQESLPK